MRVRQILFLLLSVTFVGISFIPEPALSVPPPHMRVNPTFMNFREIYVGETRENHIIIENLAGIRAWVSINPNSPFITVYRNNFNLNPGERVNVRVVFRAPDTPGIRSGRIVINTAVGIYYVPWEARVLPRSLPPPEPPARIRISPLSLNFEGVNVGEFKTVVLSIANDGLLPLHVNVNPGSPFISLSHTIFSVAPGREFPLYVTFRAEGLSPGVKSGRIVINVHGREYRVPWTARVLSSGGGGLPFPPGPSGWVSDTLVDFGEVGPGERTKYVILYNPYPYPIQVRIRSSVPWIRLSYPYVTIPPVGSYRLPISIYIDYFPEDVLEGVLTLYFPWGALDITVRVKRHPSWYPYPDLGIHVAPTHIDFGIVRYGTRKARNFLVRNNSPYPVRVRILDTAPWLRVYPYEAYIGPLSARSFRAEVNGSLLPVGLRRAMIWIDTPRGRLSVSVLARGGP